MLFSVNFMRKNNKKIIKQWGRDCQKTKGQNLFLFKETPVIPASKCGHMERKGISYSPKRGINASGVRLTPAKGFA